MKVDERKVAVDVYNLDFLGENGIWLWKFGFLTLVGTENYPTRRLDNLHLFSAIVNDFDSETINELDPNRTEHVKVFEADYTVYIETSKSVANRIISPDLESYIIVEKDVSYDDSQYLVILEDKFNGSSEKRLVDSSTLDDWTFAVEL